MMIVAICLFNEKKSMSLQIMVTVILINFVYSKHISKILRLKKLLHALFTVGGSLSTKCVS